MKTGYRVGIDVGGTFTDLICVTPDGHVVVDKAPTSREDESLGVMQGLRQLAERFDLSLEAFCSRLDIVVHGTTTADNTMIQMNGSPTGLLVTEGHRDEIEMRRDHKESIWDPTYPPPPPIARRRARIAIPERLDHSGNVILPLDEAAVRRGVRRLQKLGVRSVAVVFLFSFRNPVHELRAAEIVREEFPEVEHLSLSHEVMPRGPEFERTSTTLVNAFVAPRIARYVDRLKQQLAAAGYTRQLLIMQSTGGVMPPEYVARRAVSLLASGPTGGVMSAAHAAARVGVSDFVAADMGGTSFDISLVRGGEPEIKTDWNWHYRYYIGLPMVDVQSVGAGGGSIAHVQQGALLVGPESAGATPGPVCYGRGGERPTVTDADAVLGYLPQQGFAGGRMTLDIDAARTAIERDVAKPLGIDVVEAAWGIHRIVNANMANATRRILSSHGADSRELALIAYGGNGGVHGFAIAAELGARRFLVPRTAPAFSALGLLVANYRIDVMKSYVTPISQLDLEVFHGLIRESLVEARRDLLEPTGLSEGEVQLDLFVQMAYPGQNFDMSVPCPEGARLDSAGLQTLANRFHDLHQATRGFGFRDNPPLVRGVRLIGQGLTPKPERTAEPGPCIDPAQARKGARMAYFGDRFVETPLYDGPKLAIGALIAGPALIEEPFTVVVLGPGCRARLDEGCNYDVTLG